MMYLLTLPCGCVIDAQAILTTEDGYIECQWCAAVFCGVDFHDYCVANVDDPPPIMIEHMRPLISVANTILEVLSQCGCGSFIVRKHGGRDETHLEVPIEHFLRN